MRSVITGQDRTGHEIGLGWARDPLLSHSKHSAYRYPEIRSRTPSFAYVHMSERLLLQT